MSARPEAILVPPESAARAGDAVARGFHDNEVWCWILRDARRRERLLRRYYRTVIRHLFVPRARAWTTPDYAGGALWFAPGEPGPSPGVAARELAVLVPAVRGRGMRRALAVEAEKRRHRPTEPHWYLETLSVEPARQRAGVGTALMAPVLARCDEEGVPAYLETQRRANIPYYARFGFSLRGEISALGGPPLWLMWREPRR
jgi:GNAT superfamily N-acetyltransferase